MLRLAAASATVMLAVATVVFWSEIRTETLSLVSGSASRPDASLPTKFPIVLLDTPRTLPELHFTDGNERAMSFADFRGRVILLNLWATWCVPCRKEMPTLDRLQAKLGSPDFQVVPLSIDRQGLSVVKPFYQELALKSLGIYVDETGDAASRLGAWGLPTTLLVDREGREIGRKVGPAVWDSPQVIQAIRQYLGPAMGTGPPVAGRVPAQ